MGCGSCGNRDNCIYCNLSHEHAHGSADYNNEHHHDNGLDSAYNCHSHYNNYNDNSRNYEVSGCSCGCGHSNSHKKEKSLKQDIIKICIALFLFIVVIVIDKIFNLASINPGPENWVLPFVCYFVVYLILGLEVIREAFHGITHGELLDENFLMMIASLGAFALGIYKGCIGEQPDGFEEGCAVIIFYSIGELFESWAVGRSRKSISDLMDIRPEHAYKIVDNNKLSHECDLKSDTLENNSGVERFIIAGIEYTYKSVSPEEIEIGNLFLVKQGEKVPIDGILISENGIFDTMALTGESEYENRLQNEDVLSGSIYMGTEPVIIKATKVYSNSTVAKILYLVETASERKAKAENFITHFARIYTPIVVGLAALVAILPPIIGLIAGGSINADLTWSTWIYRALNFLVVSCPCALVISIPLSFTVGISTAGKYHILIKGSNYLELVSKVNIIVSDKTGTLTIGREIKVEAAKVISWMKKSGMKLYMLSGDKKEIVSDVAEKLGVENFAYELKPQEKYEKLEEIINAKDERDVVAYLGDGINDAPSLMRADVGISMGSVGTDAAVEASDIVLMQDDLNGIPLLKRIAKRTMTIVRENIIFSIGIKILVLILSVFGITNMWAAVFADVGVCILAVLNALRIGLHKYDK